MPRIVNVLTVPFILVHELLKSRPLRLRKINVVREILIYVLGRKQRERLALAVNEIRGIAGRDKYLEFFYALAPCTLIVLYLAAVCLLEQLHGGLDICGGADIVIAEVGDVGVIQLIRAVINKLGYINGIVYVVLLKILCCEDNRGGGGLCGVGITAGVTGRTR